MHRASSVWSVAMAMDGWGQPLPIIVARTYQPFLPNTLLQAAEQRIPIVLWTVRLLRTLHLSRNDIQATIDTL